MSVAWKEWFQSAFVDCHWYPEFCSSWKRLEPVEKLSKFSCDERHWKALLETLDGNLISGVVFLKMLSSISEWISDVFPWRIVPIIPNILFIWSWIPGSLFYGCSPAIRITSSHNIFAQLTYYICLCFMSFNGKNPTRSKSGGTENGKGFVYNSIGLNGKVLLLPHHTKHTSLRGGWWAPFKADAGRWPKILTYMGSSHKS